MEKIFEEEKDLINKAESSKSSNHSSDPQSDPSTLNPSQKFWIYIGIAFGLVAAQFILNPIIFGLNPVLERKSKMRHLQRLMGSSSTSYFFGQFAADLSVFCALSTIYLLIVTIGFVVFQETPSFSDFSLVLDGILFFFVLGSCSTSVSYFATSFYDDDQWAMGIGMLINIAIFVTIPGALSFFFFPFGLAIGIFSPFIWLSGAVITKALILSRIISSEFLPLVFLLGFGGFLLSLLYISGASFIENFKNRQRNFPNMVPPPLETNFGIESSVIEEEKKANEALVTGKYFLNANQIVKKYNNFYALSGPSFNLQENQIFGLLG